jgi:hypothetical protein
LPPFSASARSLRTGSSRFDFARDDHPDWLFYPGYPLGDVVNGLFTGRQAGDAAVTAALSGVTSDPAAVRVVTEPTIVALSVYPTDWGYQYIDGGPLRDAAGSPCFECGYFLTLLRGDTVHFSATAHYDTGEREGAPARRGEPVAVPTSAAWF